jgi:DNA polymerase-3 subunit gamma/tau
VTPQVLSKADTALGDVWFALVQDLAQGQKIQAMTRELAMQAQLLSQHDMQWVLQVERESLASAANVERLQNALADSGHAVSLTVQLGAVTDSPAMRITQEQQQRMQQAEQSVMNHPLVQQLMQTFDAKIVPGSIKPLSQ